MPTTQAIIALVDERWGVCYTVAGMTKWLHRNGFSYRKPAGVPHKYSAEAQQAFVETYEQLKQKAGDDESILFIDGVHPTQEINILRHSRRFFRCACKALLPAVPYQAHRNLTFASMDYLRPVNGLPSLYINLCICLILICSIRHQKQVTYLSQFNRQLKKISELGNIRRRVSQNCQ